MALGAIRANKLRSALTLLGIVVGVFSIIAVMTAMGVLRTSIEDGLAGLGANTFRIQKSDVAFNSTPQQRRMWRKRKNITLEEAEYVATHITLADAVGIESWVGGRIVYWRGEKTNPNISVGGENADGYLTNDVQIESGRNISDQEIADARDVVILGQTVVEKVFPPSVSPLGEQIRVDGSWYQVIGVFAPKGGALGQGHNNFIIIPITTFFQKYGKENRSVNILVRARSRDVFDECLEEARSVLRTARRVPPGDPDDFGYFSNDSLIAQFNSFTLYVRLGVLFISSIALLAAGIGIMNIMLVSVTERTREIGIRKAIGAQKKHILTQFVMEAIILCEIGGILGVVFGVLAGNVVSILLEWPAVMPWDWAAIGLGVCSLVGIVFGVYPAWKASTLDPIDALRYE
ncbi:MAG: ABC transporter permease [Ignavibacteriae bacterium]|nr:ABC transporter permease [Ignavibacteriota bacterium]